MTCRETVLIIVILGLFAIVHTNAYSDEKLEEAMRQEALLKDYATLVAGCMNKDSIIWTDPHTGKDMAAECKVYEVGVIHAR